MMSLTCPFCNIASGKAETSTVFENETVLAFMDLSPAAEGHTLVIPRGHWENIYDVPDDILADIAIVVKRVCVAAKKAVGADGVKVIQLNGRAAGQVVFHLHFHIIPIMSRDCKENSRKPLRCWWARPDLNRRSLPREGSVFWPQFELTNWTTSPCFQVTLRCTISFISFVAGSLSSNVFVYSCELFYQSCAALQISKFFCFNNILL
jgi:histidine triad (HIT) family protein